MINTKSKFLPSVLLASTMLLTANAVNAAIVSIDYSGSVDSSTDPLVSIGELIGGNFTIDTTDFVSVEGDASKKDYFYSGSGTYGSINTVNKGSVGSNTVVVGIENDNVLDTGLVIDVFYVTSFSEDFVWDEVQDRAISGTHFAISFAFSSDTLSSTDLDFNTLLNLSNPLASKIWIAEYDAYVQLNEVIADVDYMNSTISEVPVPTAVWLFGSGLLGLFGLAKRKAHA